MAWPQGHVQIAPLTPLGEPFPQIDPATIGMIECHGTGTYMGDPIEVAALTQAFRNHGSDAAEANQFCRIGSVKTNIGHLDTAAGVVGLMKAALALQNEEMPPTINYEQPNPEIGFERTPSSCASTKNSACAFRATRTNTSTSGMTPTNGPR